VNKIVKELKDRMVKFDESEDEHKKDCESKGIKLESYSLGYGKTKELYNRIINEIERLEQDLFDWNDDFGGL